MIKTQLASVVSSISLALASIGAYAGPNGNIGTQDAPVNSLAANQSAALCTVAVNSDGTIAGGSTYVSSSALLSTGNYEVIFKGPCNTNITALKGYARFVQVDTLTSGSISGGVSCTTADRAGNPAGVFIHCENSAAAATNTSFFLMVSR